MKPSSSAQGQLTCLHSIVTCFLGFPEDNAPRLFSERYIAPLTWALNNGRHNSKSHPTVHYFGRATVALRINVIKGKKSIFHLPEKSRFHITRQSAPPMYKVLIITSRGCSTYTALHTAILFVRLLRYAAPIFDTSLHGGNNHSSLHCAWYYRAGSSVPKRSILEGLAALHAIRGRFVASSRLVSAITADFFFLSTVCDAV